MTPAEEGIFAARNDEREINGILVVEADEFYQPIGAVASINEAIELARNYEKNASPDNDETQCPPEIFVVWTRRLKGLYSERTVIDIER